MGVLPPVPRARLRGRSTRFWATTAFWLAAVAFAAASVWWFGDSTPLEFVYTAVAVGTILGRKALPADDDRKRPVRNLGYGLLAVVAALQFARIETLVPLGALLAAGGVWGVLDGVQGLRHGPPDADADEADSGRDPGEIRADRIEEELADRPMTRREIDDLFDHYPERTEAAVARLRERETVERTGSGFRIRDPEPAGRVARLRRRVAGDGSRIRSGLERLVRPVAVEFRDSDDGEERSLDSEATKPARRSDGRETVESAGDRLTRRPGSERSRRERETERS